MSVSHFENCKFCQEQHQNQKIVKSVNSNSPKDFLIETINQYQAYDLFMQCMHPNGIPYDIIKKSLPLINGEIAKVLANIVDFVDSMMNDYVGTFLFLGLGIVITYYQSKWYEYDPDKDF